MTHTPSREQSRGQSGATEMGEKFSSEDPIELWGRRIGRGLAIVALLVFAGHLLFTYLR